MLPTSTGPLLLPDQKSQGLAETVFLWRQFVVESTSLSSGQIQEILSCLRSLPEIAQQAKRLCDLLESSKSVPQKPTIVIDEQDAAIAALTRFGPNMAAIAKYVGVNRTTLYRSEKFSEFRDLFDLAKQEAEDMKETRRRRGHKSTDGDFEAWE